MPPPLCTGRAMWRCTTRGTAAFTWWMQPVCSRHPHQSPRSIPAGSPSLTPIIHWRGLHETNIEPTTLILLSFLRYMVVTCSTNSARSLYEPNQCPFHQMHLQVCAKYSTCPLPSSLTFPGAYSVLGLHMHTHELQGLVDTVQQSTTATARMMNQVALNTRRLALRTHTIFVHIRTNTLFCR